jgi:hypothetical protein
MSDAMGISLAIISLGSCWASYVLGRESAIREIRERRDERRRRWEEFDDED